MNETSQTQPTLEATRQPWKAPELSKLNLEETMNIVGCGDDGETGSASPSMC
jgi:hypothetical protein